LVKAVPDKAALLIVGDVDQLRLGQALADVIASGTIRVVRLTELFCQVAETRITVNAHSINQGIIPDIRKPVAESDFYFVAATDPETAVARIIDLVKTHIPRRFGLDPIRDIQVLCPMNRAWCRRRLPQYRASGSAESCGRAEGREVRLDLRAWRQSHADRERLRQGGL
jgi:exodeoxyribonuclease V alpha subunit